MHNEEMIKKITYIENAIKKSESLRQSAIAKKDVYEAQLKSLEEELRKMGVEPENIDATIEHLNEEIKKELEIIEELIPFDLLKEFNIKIG